jgi:acetyl esterase/lipase
MYLLTWLVLLILFFWAFERFYLRGKRLVEYLPPSEPGTLTSFKRPQGPGPEHLEVVSAIRELSARISARMRKDELKVARTLIDSISDGHDYSSEFLPVDAGGVPAEWVLATGADTNRRLLYIHGGGFIMGSPKSHRTATNKLSEIASCAVLSIDYRLMPEHQHMDCLEDCKRSYQWILENGPDGPEDIRQLFIAGDSAGGNLALSLVAWLRDNGLRAPDAVVALSPLTDLTFSGASIRSNEATDIMLRPILRPLNRLPQFIKSWWAVFTHRMRPCNPVASPLFGDLSGLPPTLVQASEAEMLLDDARRYVYKACASGSPVKLQTWSDMLHVWQLFDPPLPQAAEAWVEIGKFLDTYMVDMNVHPTCLNHRPGPGG